MSTTCADALGKRRFIPHAELDSIVRTVEARSETGADGYYWR
jgi:hypothetical protein